MREVFFTRTLGDPMPLLLPALIACHHPTSTATTADGAPAELVIDDGLRVFLGVLHGADRDRLVLRSGKEGPPTLGWLGPTGWTTVPQTDPALAKVRGLLVRDVNGDGVDELALPAAKGAVFTLQGEQLAVAPDLQRGEFTLADVTGDGKLDRLFLRQERFLSVTPATETGFGPMVQTWLPVQNDALDYGRRPVDFDADGRVDVFAEAGKSGFLLGYGRPDGGFDLERVEVGYATTFADVGDIDGDGRIDLLLRAEGGYVILLAGPDRTWKAPLARGTCAPDTGLRGGLALADLDGDHKSETVYTRLPLSETQLMTLAARHGEDLFSALADRAELVIRRGTADAGCEAPRPSPPPALDARRASAGPACVARDAAGTTLRWTDGSQTAVINARASQTFADPQSEDRFQWDLSADGNTVAFTDARELTGRPPHPDEVVNHVYVWRQGKPLWMAGTASRGQPAAPLRLGPVFLDDAGQTVAYGAWNEGEGGWDTGVIVETVGGGARTVVAEGGMRLLDLSADGQRLLVLEKGKVVVLDWSATQRRALGDVSRYTVRQAVFQGEGADLLVQDDETSAYLRLVLPAGTTTPLDGPDAWRPAAAVSCQPALAWVPRVAGG